MKISVSITPEKWYNSVHELLRSAFVDYEIYFGTEKDVDLWLKLTVDPETDPNQVSFAGELKNADGNTLHEKQQSVPLAKDTPEREKEVSRLLRIFVFEWMCEYLGSSFSEYGILSGVRPLKLIHRCLDEGMTDNEILRYMGDNYRVSPEKARFLLEVAGNNHFLLNSREEAKTQIGIYVGIPYCPTRCYYCSFPGAILRNYEKDIPPFLAALHKELTAIGQYLTNSPFTVQNLYIGGGTPTVLNEYDLAQLLDTIGDTLNLSACREFTVEAGRPDTLNPEKLRILKDYGIDRMCVNPQTMNDVTLERIGRRHTAAEIENAVALAREAGIRNINMDLKVGS